MTYSEPTLRSVFPLIDFKGNTLEQEWYEGNFADKDMRMKLSPYHLGNSIAQSRVKNLFKIAKHFEIPYTYGQISTDMNLAVRVFVRDDLNTGVLPTSRYNGELNKFFEQSNMIKYNTNLLFILISKEDNINIEYDKWNEKSRNDNPNREICFLVHE